MSFTTENTTGYSQIELDALNAELSRRLCEVDEPDRDEVAKNFADEVACYPLPTAAPGLTVVIGVGDNEAFLMDGSTLHMPCDVALEAEPGIMAAWFHLDGGQRGTIWYWPGEGRAAVMMGGDSDWYDFDGATLKGDDGVDIPLALLLTYGMPSGFEDGIYYRDTDADEWITPTEAVRRVSPFEVMLDEGWTKIDLDDPRCPYCGAELVVTETDRELVEAGTEYGRWCAYCSEHADEHLDDCLKYRRPARTN
jgi:hypothetical protein